MASSKEWKTQAEKKEWEIDHLREDRDVLLGRIVAMESRELVVGSRVGGEVESRLTEFEQRMGLLMGGREGGIT